MPDQTNEFHNVDVVVSVDPSSLSSGEDIVEECALLMDLLLRKNKAYGDSALNPLRVFSKADAEEQIRVRLDDKLSRLLRGSGPELEDVEQDILGYLILARIARKRRQSVLENPQ